MLNKNQQTEATKFQPIAFRVKELAEKKRASDPAFK